MIDKNDPRLTAYLLGELDDTQSAEIRTALQESSELREHFEGLRDTVDVLEGAFGGMLGGGDTLTAEQLAAVEAASKDEVVAPPVEAPPVVTPISRGPSKSRQLYRVLATAALVLCAGTLAFIAYQRPQLASGIWVEKGSGQSSVEPSANKAAIKDAVGDRAADEQSLLEEPSTDEPAELSEVESAETEEASALSAMDGPWDASVSPPAMSVPASELSARVQGALAFRHGEGSDALSPANASRGEASGATPIGGRGFSESDPAARAEMLEEGGDGKSDAGNQDLPGLNLPGGSSDRGRKADWSAQISRASTDPLPAPTAPMPVKPRTADGFSGGGGLGGGGGGLDPVEGMMGGGMEMGGRGVGRNAPAASAEMDMEMGMMGGMDMAGTEMMDMMGGMDMDGKDVAGMQMGMGTMDMSRGGATEGRSAQPVTAGFDAISGLPSSDSDITSGSDGESRGSGRRRFLNSQRTEPFGDVDEIAEMAVAPESKDSGVRTIRLQSQNASERLSVVEESEPTNRSSESADTGEGVLGDVQVQFVPELGQILLKGSTADVNRVREMIADIEQKAGIPQEAAEGEESTPEATLIELQKRMAAFRQKKLAQPAKPKTWKPASASTNRARLSIGHHDDLKLTARDTYVRIDGFRARVMFDLYYYNDRPRQLEGQFLLRLPDDASLHYFAFGATNVVPPPRQPQPPTPGKGGGIEPPVDPAEQMLTALRDKTDSTGSDLARRATDPEYKADSGSIFAGVKTAYVTPKQKAALAYEETVRRRVDPALVEWSGPGIFQTKVFPLMPRKLHRIVVGYDVSLKDLDDDRLFTLDLPEDEAGGRVEFDLAALPGTEAKLTPEMDAFVSGGRAYYRYEAAPPRDYSVRLSGTESIVLNHTGELGDQYFATRVLADLPEQAAKLESRQAVFLLDTSWSDRPVAFSRRLKLLEAILTENRDGIDEFAVMMFNVQQRWWNETFVANNEENVAEFLKMADDLALEGATDLHSAISAAKKIAWQDTTKVASTPNLFLLSDAVATWGITDLAALSQVASRGEDGGGAMFAYQMAGHPSDRVMLRLLADASRGAVFSVAENEELKTAAVAHRSLPWRLASVSADGATEVLVQSASDTIYPGQPLVVSGVGERTGPIKLVFQRGSETEALTIDPKLAVKSPAAARLYGQLAVERLEPHAVGLEQIAIAYARYFRVPGRTCSMVMLESEADYKRFGVNTSPEEDQLVIASTSVTRSIERLEAESQSKRANPHSRFVAWVDSLEKANLVKVSTALRLAIEQMPDSAFQFAPRPLECRGYLKSQMPQTYLDELALERPEFDSVMTEAEQMLIKFGADDALKTASTLIEAKPSDVDTLRSVAFRAFEWQRADQAAPLLWRIAEARPYQPQCLLLLGRSYAESGDLDSAMVCYDLVTAGNWNQRWASGARDIARAELLNVLTKLDPSKSSIGGYARARERQIRKAVAAEDFDIAVIMHWNTDRTDVDLHVTEPGGEVCYYQNRKTKLGGKITQDVTQGLGPEMYVLADAPAGEYHVEAKYFRQDQNRTKAPTETLFTVIRYLGEEGASVQTKRVTLNGKGERQSIVRLRVQE